MKPSIKKPLFIILTGLFHIITGSSDESYSHSSTIAQKTCNVNPINPLLCQQNTPNTFHNLGLPATYNQNNIMPSAKRVNTATLPSQSHNAFTEPAKNDEEINTQPAKSLGYIITRTDRTLYEEEELICKSVLQLDETVIHANLQILKKISAEHKNLKDKVFENPILKNAPETIKHMQTSIKTLLDIKTMFAKHGITSSDKITPQTTLKSLVGQENIQSFQTLIHQTITLAQKLEAEQGSILGKTLDTPAQDGKLHHLNEHIQQTLKQDEKKLQKYLQATAKKDGSYSFYTKLGAVTCTSLMTTAWLQQYFANTLPDNRTLKAHDQQDDISWKTILAKIPHKEAIGGVLVVGTFLALYNQFKRNNHQDNQETLLKKNSPSLPASPFGSSQSLYSESDSEISSIQSYTDSLAEQSKDITQPADASDKLLDSCTKLVRQIAADIQEFDDSVSTSSKSGNFYNEEHELYLENLPYEAQQKALYNELASLNFEQDFAQDTSSTLSISGTTTPQLLTHPIHFTDAIQNGDIYSTVSDSDESKIQEEESENIHHSNNLIEEQKDSITLPLTSSQTNLHFYANEEQKQEIAATSQAMTLYTQKEIETLEQQKIKKRSLVRSLRKGAQKRYDRALTGLGSLSIAGALASLVTMMQPTATTRSPLNRIAGIDDIIAARIATTLASEPVKVGVYCTILGLAWYGVRNFFTRDLEFQVLQYNKTLEALKVDLDAISEKQKGIELLLSTVKASNTEQNQLLQQTILPKMNALHQATVNQREQIEREFNKIACDNFSVASSDSYASMPVKYTSATFVDPLNNLLRKIFTGNWYK